MSKVLFDAQVQQQTKKEKELQERLQAIKAAANQHPAQDETTGGAVMASTERFSSNHGKNHMINQTLHEDNQHQVSTHRDPAEYSEVLRDAPPARGWLAAFVPQPEDFRFDTQHAKEKVLLVLRQHPVVNLSWLLVVVLLVLAPILLVPVLPFFSFLPDKYTFFASVAWYIFVLMYAIEQFINWYFNIYIITDERVIDIDFYNLIYKEVSEAQIDHIEDVTATTAGIMGAIFNYGNICIQTAGEKNQFDFLRVPQPAKVTKFLNELQIEEEQEKLDGRAI